MCCVTSRRGHVSAPREERDYGLWANAAHRDTTSLVLRTLNVYVAQGAAGCAHHVSDRDFSVQPVGRDDRTQLCKASQHKLLHF